MNRILLLLLAMVSFHAFGQRSQTISADCLRLTVAGTCIEKAEFEALDGISSNIQTQLNAKDSITPGTTSQYYRGDKTWQTLNKSAVGLGNVDNTSDLNKPISTATQSALDLKLTTPTDLPIIRPTLNLDFANSKTLDPRVTFERNSNATRINEKGMIENVSPHVPRFDHDPVTGESLGLLIEESRTNLLTYSNDFANSAWTKTRASIIPNATTAPDGSLTASKLVEDTTASSTHLIVQNQSFTSGSTYTYLMFLKSAERSAVFIGLPTAQFGGTTTGAYFDVSSGVSSSGYGGASPLIRKFTNGWYLISVTATATATGNAAAYIQISTGTSAGNTNYTGDGSSGIYIWGAQLEVGAFPTSYIPTEATTVTRVADLASMTGANFSSWYNQSEGTFVSKFNANSSASYQGRIFELSLSPYDSDNNRVAHFINNLASVLTTMSTNGVSQLSSIASSYTSKSDAVTAVALKANDVIQAKGGALSAGDSSVSLPLVDRLFIGNTRLGTHQTNGTISRISYYPRRLTNAELQAVTK